MLQGGPTVIESGVLLVLSTQKVSAVAIGDGPPSAGAHCSWHTVDARVGVRIVALVPGTVRILSDGSSLHMR